VTANLRPENVALENVAPENVAPENGVLENGVLENRAAEQAGPASPPPGDDESGSFLAGLFGRGLIYVVVTSLPIFTAAIVSPILAHLLGPEDFGMLAAAISLHQVLMAGAIFGIDQALILMRAEAGGERSARMLVTAGTMLALALTVLASSTFALWAGVLGFDHSSTLALVTVLWTVPTTFLQLGLALLMARDKLRAFAVVSILLTLGSQVIGLILLLLGPRLAGVYAWGGLAGRLLAMTACLVLVRPRWFARGDWTVVRTALLLGLPIALGALSSFVLNSGDRLVIQRLLGPEEVGRYQVAYTIGFEAITVFCFTGEAWAARFAAVRDDARRWRLLGQARDHVYELLAPAMLGVNLAAPLMLRIFAPASFRPYGLVLVVLVVTFSAVPTIATLGSTRALITQRRTKPIAVAAGVAAAVNLGLNFGLVPFFGLLGSAAATVVSIAVQAFLLRVAFRPYKAWPRTPARIVITLLATNAAASAFAFAPQSLAWIALRTFLGLLAGVWMVVTFLRRRADHLGHNRVPDYSGSAPEAVVAAASGAETAVVPASLNPMARLTTFRRRRSASVSGSRSTTTDT
jgi:O-antigen/teichoic acid export membrane protein